MSDLRQQLQSTLGNAYTIERELGGGGMSRVFLATEQSLGRLVVVKVLASETAGAVSVERFRREIRLAASLQQANIIPVLSSATRAASITTRCPSSAFRHSVASTRCATTRVSSGSSRSSSSLCGHWSSARSANCASWRRG